MKSNIPIPLFVVLAIIATAMMPLAIQDGISVSAEENGTDNNPFLIYNADDLSMVGGGIDNPEGYTDWTLDKCYKLANDVVFSQENNTNGGIMFDLRITYSGSIFTIVLTPEDSVSVLSYNIWIGTNHSSNSTVTVPSAGIYKMLITGTHSGDGGTFAYATEVEVLQDMNDWKDISAQFDSNGNFDPIGTLSKPFTGTFDGAGYRISGMNISMVSSGDAYTGLFGYTDGAKISGIGLTDGNIISVSLSGEVYTGGIAGKASSAIADCYSTSNIIACTSNDYTTTYVGGIAGITSSSVANCHNAGDAAAIIAGYVSDASVGGIVGKASSISNCYNTGDITITTNYDVDICAGGIAGEESGITNCYNMGDMTINAGIRSSLSIGGIVGKSKSSTISECYNTGDMTISKNVYSSVATGGIAGVAGSSQINNCFNTGDFDVGLIGSGFDIAYTGGGIAGTASSVANCYNTGDFDLSLFGYDDKIAYTGGIAGTASSVTNCYNVGSFDVIVDGDGIIAYTGGIAGTASSYPNNYFLGASGLNTIGDRDGQTGSSTAEDMKLQSNYQNWDFLHTWGITSDFNNGFPILIVFLFDLELSVNNSGGTITGQDQIYGGEDAVVNICPDYVYRIDWVTDNGNDVTTQVSVNGEYIVTNIFGDRTIIASFTENMHAITVNSPDNGTVTADKTEALHGSDVTITIVPDDGFGIMSVTDNGNDVTDQVSVNGEYIITNISGDHSVIVVFAKNRYTITVNSPDNGTVTADKTEALRGSDVTITIIPKDGFRIRSVTDNGTDVKDKVSDGKYVIYSISADHSVEAEFEAIPSPAPDGNGGTLIILAIVATVIGFLFILMWRP